MRSVLLGGLLLLAACSTGSDNIRWEEVSRAELGDMWPFTMSAGSLGCMEPGAVVFSPENSETIYAVNGLADARAGLYDWRDMRPIWLDENLEDWPPEAVAWLRESGGGKVNISSVIDRGLDLCGE